jgi:hypothetical protein
VSEKISFGVTHNSLLFAGSSNCLLRLMISLSALRHCQKNTAAAIAAIPNPTPNPAPTPMIVVFSDPQSVAAVVDVAVAVIVELIVIEGASGLVPINAPADPA